MHDDDSSEARGIIHLERACILNITLEPFGSAVLLTLEQCIIHNASA
jgi:hypothetical protein